jgi:radical SAM superfamily enzyme YgiQ (UPF0313 family)
MSLSKRILAINPWIYDFAAYDLWIKPLGLLYIISILKQHNIDVDFIDCLDRFDEDMSLYYAPLKKTFKKDGRGKFYKEPVEKPEVLKDIPRIYGRYGITEEIFKRKINSIEKPDLILVTSMMTYWYPGVFKIIEILKNKFPDVKVLLGGIYTILFYEHAKKYSNADLVIASSDLNEITKIIFNQLNISIQNFDYSNFNDVPPPDYSGYKYVSNIAFMTSKGCPYNCAFCASKKLSPGYSVKSPEKIIDEIIFFQKKFDTTNYVFYDDALLLNAENNIKIFLKELLKQNIKTTFQTPNAVHAKFIDEEVAELMKETNFQNIRIGYEAYSIIKQKDMNYKVSNELLKRAVKNLLKAGFTRKDIGVYLIIGFPEETYEELKAGADFIIDIGAHCRLSDYSPVPYTDYWLKFDNFDKIEPLLHNNSFFLTSVHPELKEKYSELKNYVKKFY